MELTEIKLSQDESVKWPVLTGFNETWQKRVAYELAEVEYRVRKLAQYLYEHEDDEENTAQKELMQEQLKIMDSYRGILLSRLIQALYTEEMSESLKRLAKENK